MVSQAEAQGQVVVVTGLSEIQGASFPGPTVVVAHHVGGIEDIPVSTLARQLTYHSVLPLTIRNAA